MGTVDPAYIDRLQEDIIIACHRLEQTGHESLVITVSEEGHLIFGSQKGKNFLDDKHVFIEDFVLHCQNSETVVKVETEIDENAEIIEDKELINTNSKPKKSLSIGERDLTHEETRDLTHKETGKDGTKTEKEKEGENNVLVNLESSAGVETNMFDDDTDDYDDTEALSPVEAKLETAADSAAVDELAGEEFMNVDGDYTVVTVKEEQPEHEAEESSKGNSKRMSDAKVVLKRINMIINSNQSTKLRSKKLKVQKMGKKTKGKDTGTTACDICGKELSCSTAVNRHKICFHSDKKNHECEECGKKFKLPEGLMRHRTVHSAEKEFKCETCSKSFKRLEYLKSHMKTHDPVKPYNCAECGKSFMKKETLDNHERVHSGEKAIECKERSVILAAASETGSSPYIMQDEVEHADVEAFSDQAEPSDAITVPDDVAEPPSSKPTSEVKAFSCHQCTYMTEIKHNLLRHIRSVHKEKDAIICTDCGKAFKSENALSEHKVKHKKDFFCEHCGKIFHSRKGICIHKISTHGAAGMKYKCFICSKLFYEKAHFTGHLNAHNNSEPYQCSKCRKSFSYKSNLLRHQKICIRDEKNCENCSCNASSTLAATPEDHLARKQGEAKLYRCVCGQFFKWRSTLGKHRKQCILWKVKNIPCN